MMREILFRGKRMENGEWIEGSHLADGEAHRPLDEENMPFSNCYIVPETDPENIQTVFNDGSYFLSVTGYHVIPETVGQFTGLTDKNGKKIFEGDVIRYTEQTINGSDIPCVGKVEFSDGGWAVNVWYLSNWLFDSANGNVQLEGIEVIGNIHDNPELLEGERQ